MRWVACTEHSPGAGGGDGGMGGECRRGVHITRSTEVGLDRGVSDARATIQRHARWVACTESSSGTGGGDGGMGGECKCDVAGTDSTQAGRDRVVLLPQRCLEARALDSVRGEQLWRGRGRWLDAWRHPGRSKSRQFGCRSDGSEAHLARSGHSAVEIQFSLAGTSCVWSTHRTANK